MTELGLKKMSYKNKVSDSSGYINEAADSDEEDEQITIYQACRNGDVRALEKMLSDRRIQIKIDDCDDNGLTALHYAARDKHFEVAKLLIEKGKSYAASKDEDGATPLHYCARKKQKYQAGETRDLIHMLAYLTDVNLRDRYLCTPLHFAAMRGNDLAAQALLDCKGVDVNAQDAMGYTPLHEAAVFNDVQVALLLIKYGADIGTEDVNGRTSLHYAVMGEDSVNMVKVLLQNINEEDVPRLINKKDKDNNAALHLAIDARNIPAVKMLLKKGARVNDACRTSSSGSTPLHLAAITGDTQMVSVLLNKKAKLFARDLGGSTPLHKAVEYQNRDAVELLLQQMRVPPEQKDKESYTPLLVAACYNDVTIVNALLDAGSDVSAEDRQDRNVFHLAAANNAKDIIKALIRYAKETGRVLLLNDEDRKGETPLHIAARMGYTDVAQLLIESGVDLSLKNEDEETAFLLAAKTGNTDLVELFIQTSEKVLNDQDELSNSALHLAAAGGHVAVVETLVRNGADKDMRNVRLDTPMDHACYCGHLNVVKFLLDEEVSPNDDDEKKDTPLLLAARNGHQDVVEVLIDNGADVTAADKEGRNCLSLAIDKGNREVAKAIIQSPHWKKALLQELNHHGHIRDTPMRKLIRNMPDIAQLVLNRMITTSPDEVHPSDPNFWYHFNFTFMDDTYYDYTPRNKHNKASAIDDMEYDQSKVYDASSTYTKNKIYLLENHPIKIMVSKKRDDLLSHPLCMALIRNKWNACRPAYFGYMVYYAAFLCVISAFMVVSKAPYMDGGTCTPPGNEWIQGSFEKGSKFFIMIYCCLGIIFEVIQLVTELQLYLIEPLNILDWFTYISAILVVLDLAPCGAKTDWQWQLGTFCLFMTWMNFLLLLRRVPVIGIYAVMIQDILKTFSKFLIVFLLFLLAFSLTFYSLVRNQSSFKTPGEAVVKTWAMLLGELDYDNLFYPEDNADAPKYTSVTYIAFVVFLIVMATVIMNLMTGLAIDDVTEMQRHARLRKLAIQMELAIAMELSMPRKLRRWMNFCVSGMTIFANHEENAVTRFIHLVMDGKILNKQSIVSSVRGLEGEEQSEISHLEQKIDRFMNTRREDMQAINGRLDKLEGMMERLITSKSVGRFRKKLSPISGAPKQPSPSGI